MDNQQNNFEIIEEEAFASSSESITKEQIIMRALQKCMTEGAKEMDGGGIKRRIVNGQSIEFIAPNQREVFINSIKMFCALMQPEIDDINALKKANGNIKEIIKTLEEFESKQIKLNKEYAQAFIKAKQEIRLQQHKEEGSNKNYNLQLNMIKQQLDEQLEIKQVELYKEKLEVAIQVLSYKNYFQERSA